MSGSADPNDPSRWRRGERILDVTAELILSWGCRRVTVDEVAKRAGVGKGTVYLHWKARDELFHAVLMRESSAVTGEVLALMRADPTEILPHRLVRHSFTLSLRRPLLVALLTRDSDVLDRIVEVDVHSGDTGPAETWEYLDLLRERGLVRTELGRDAQLYVLELVGSGAFLLEPWLPRALRLDLGARAATLEHLVRAAFGPVKPPDEAALHSAAATVIALFERLRARTAAAVHGTPVDATRTR